MRLRITLNATLGYLLPCSSTEYRVFLCQGVHLPTIPADIHGPEAHAFCHLDWTGCQSLLYCAGVIVATYYEIPRSGETWVSVLQDGCALIPLRWWQAQLALAIVLDIFFFVLPLPAIFKLNMPTRQRFSVIAVFSLALM